MVDSQIDTAMADRIDALTERVQAVEERVQTVEEKLDLLSASVDRRFDGVDVALLEQRQYTEFAFSRLEAKMDAGFARFDERFDRSDNRFDRLERKLDQFIDVQLQANQLVERRLTALEQQPGRA